ncbi:macro domain-containing protein [Streptomyces griseoloalbus]|uniref:O-acetyl-ADP-ribose deacetylase (Regulator of RNase III) n=1 Tax=Streptomyces griseoloalbus TaxID=67303 RepID=A0A7W8FBK4_9ACTN|nr:macro domain-containing protein [Streptomyces albaduncus]MBB5128375.1 O-acetyl-ADP-ribose deacetylase (regulator of RNase III) [Streptomyces albaduncus]
MDALPSHQELTEELKCLRRLGFPRLRHCSRDGLRAAAVAAGFCVDADDELEGIEELLGAAVRRLGGGDLRDADDCDPLARAAAHSFGLFAYRRGVPASDRRKAAAGVYGVSTERFRKSQEHEVLDGLASAVLALARSGRPAAPGDVRSGAPGDSRPGAPGGVRSDPRTAVRTLLTGPVPGDARPPGDLRAPGGLRPGPSGRRPAPGGLRPLPAASRPVPGRVTVRLTPIEEIRDIDILVSSENVYLEMSKTFRPTVSGVLRRAAAERSDGEVVDDVLARELAVWLHAHRRTGLAVRPGTVVPTSAGALSRQGVRRVYHAAVATPVDHGSRYHVAPGTVTEAVRQSFELARAERKTLALPLTSICFPLLGAGRGGLPAADAAAHLLGAVREELRRDPSWSVLLVTRRREYAGLLRDANSGP